MESGTVSHCGPPASDSLSLGRVMELPSVWRLRRQVNWPTIRTDIQHGGNRRQLSQGSLLRLQLKLRSAAHIVCIEIEANVHRAFVSCP